MGNNSFDGPDGQPPPVWEFRNGGREIYQKINSAPFAALRTEEFEGVEYEGTLFVDANTGDNDFVGVIWGFAVKLDIVAIIHFVNFHRIPQISIC